jgi:glycerol-3-phosphate acyltransferase PlsY
MHESIPAIVVVLASYALGCFSTGYYLYRLRTGGDIRIHGSGSAGARNVGRALGKSAFVVTLAVDVVKGALAVWAARHIGLSPTGVILTMLAVVMGHIWPLQLRFQGGKGIATALGALLAFDPRLAIPLVLLFCLLLPLFKHFTLSGLAVVASVPAVAALRGYPGGQVFGMAFLVTIILFAHRTNIRAIFRELRPKQDESTARLLKGASGKTGGRSHV